jgi:hypothetical protein
MYEINYKENSEQEILEATISGDLDFEAAKIISSETRKKANELDYDLIKDVRDVNLKASVTDAIDFFNSSKNPKLDIKHKKVMVAMIVNGKNYDFFKFWETVASNNGMISKVFLDKEKAFLWLENKDEVKQN